MRNRTPSDDFVSRQRDVRGRPVLVIGRSFARLAIKGAGKAYQKLMPKKMPVCGLGFVSESQANGVLF